MKMSYKIAGVILFFTLSTSTVLYLIALRSQKSSFDQIAHDHVRQVQQSFLHLEERDVRMLSATLESVVRDTRLRDIYLRKDRDELYACAQALFRVMVSRYGITHLYFILPDGRVFLRMHNRELYGDLVQRRSFLKAKATAEPAWEMELGKTAFALRTVMPYLYNGKLIGYVEAGERIDHFLTILKQETSSEFGIIGDKEHLDRDDWTSLRQVAGLRDNWDDMGRHVLLSSTSSDELTTHCVAEENLERAEKGETIFQQLQIGKRQLICGGFGLNDTSGQHVGGLLFLLDISEHAATARQANRTILYSAAFMFVLTSLVGIMLSRSFTRPIMRLVDITKDVARGNLSQNVDVGGTDELGQLGSAFNTMLEKRRQAEEAIRASNERLEARVAERTAALTTANERLHNLSAHLQDMCEQERTTLAREIHDELGQSLTALKLELSLLRKGLSSDQQEAADKAESMSELLESTMHAVKRISLELRPEILDHLGITAAMEWQAGEFEKRTGLPCTVSFGPATIELDNDRAIAVFRIFQETLTNVARHAEADTVAVRLSSDGDVLTLQVTDDGKGMTEAQRTNEGSFGLLGIQERIQVWDGTLSISSAPGAGTTVIARIPLKTKGVSS